MNYDPNMIRNGCMANQTVRLTFGKWKYRKTFEIVVGGNCLGLDVIDAAVCNVLGTLYDDTDCATIILEHPTEGLLDCSDYDGYHEEWLKEMLISAEIISIIAE